MVEHENIIGILGAYGGVGREAAEALSRVPGLRLRLGARNLDKLRASFAGFPHQLETVWADVEDHASLLRFCLGCKVVIGCAGASSSVGERVAAAALAVGANYVDPGGDEDVGLAIATRMHTTPNLVALLGAGMMPGLTGLLPRWLARRDRARPVRLVAHAGTHDRFTRGAALDYVASLRGGYGEPLLAIVNGARARSPSTARSGVEVPFFPGRVDVYPYLTREAERVAKALELRELEWFNVMEGPHTMAAVARIQARTLCADELESAADAIARAAEIDLLGRSPYQLFSFRLERADGSISTLVLRARSAYALSGALSAWSALEILNSNVRRGCHFADVALDPRVVERLGSLPDVELFDIFEETSSTAEEGTV